MPRPRRKPARARSRDDAPRRDGGRRALWTGAISFGLVHIPVNLYPGTTPQSLDLDLLDKRDFAPVGYRRVNKRTGKEVTRENIVKGYEHAKGEYVVVTDEDFRQANVKATQTIEIQAFVDAAQIPGYYFDVPYFLEPAKRGEKGYVLLRETLRRAERVGIATVVLRARQHLAVVMPVERMLVLNTLRYATEIRPASKLALPGEAPKGAGVTPKELEMAERLVADMTEDWRPERYRDSYTEGLLARIEDKVKSGKTHAVSEPDEAGEPRESAQVIDLMAALKRSLDRRGGAARGEPAAPRRKRA
jgi:DNA end-binding protein Ku